MKKKLFVFIPILALLAGCLGDSVTEVQVVERPIYPPGQVFYSAITGTLDLQIRWNPSVVDTQGNFKGYLVKLYKSTATPGIITDTAIGALLDSIHVPKTDTSKIFTNRVTQEGRYTVKVWGERNPDPAVPDSVVTSVGSSDLSFDFDSRELFAPKEIYASSNGQNGVNLFWSKSNWEGNIGAAGYVIRYVDPDNSSSHLSFLAKTYLDSSNTVRGYRTAFVVTPPNLTTPVEKRYKFWIKAIRKDSVESADSISIIWSGAEMIPPGGIPVKLDTALFFGAVGFGYNMVQVDPNDANNALLQVTTSGTDVVLIGKNGTQFSSKIDQDSALRFSTNFLAAPLANADFNMPQISFPAVGTPDQGTMIYALFPGGSRARILLSSSQDSL
ncbi:MAG: hypothetical protein ABI778_05165, partial [Ignavibacteriota bacterium]